MIRDFLAGRLGVDAIAFVSMMGALLLGETLAGVVLGAVGARWKATRRTPLPLRVPSAI